MPVVQNSEAENSEDKLQISSPGNQSGHKLWLADQLTVLAEAFGQELLAARLRVYTEDLADLTRPQLEIALVRARHELTFFPKIAELRQMAGAGEEQQDAEGRKAWDVLTAFVSRYVSNDVHGNFGPQYGWYKNFPKLSQRILDTVRRTGSWRTYKCMTDEDFPFVQKRFFEEYKSWTAVEEIDAGRLLTQAPVLHLIAGDVKTVEETPTVDTTSPIPARVAIKKIPERLTRAQLRDRREMLRQQVARLRRQGTSMPQAESSTSHQQELGPECA